MQLRVSSKNFHSLLYFTIPNISYSGSHSMEQNIKKIANQIMNLKTKKQKQQFTYTVLEMSFEGKYSPLLPLYFMETSSKHHYAKKYFR